jgi:hypothetical protein
LIDRCRVHPPNPPPTSPMAQESSNLDSCWRSGPDRCIKIVDDGIDVTGFESPPVLVSTNSIHLYLGCSRQKCGWRATSGEGRDDSASKPSKMKARTESLRIVLHQRSASKTYHQDGTDGQVTTVACRGGSLGRIMRCHPI